MKVLYYLGFIIGVLLGGIKRISSVPAIKTAKFIAQKIKNSEKEGSK